MDYKSAAVEILAAIGGKRNIASVSHCMTRLRFVLRDDGIPKDSEVERIPGVMGVMKQGGQYQLIIGNNVKKCHDELIRLLEDRPNEPDDTDGSAPVEKKKVSPLNAALDFIAGCMTPIIPAIIAGGLVKVLLVLFGESVIGLIRTGSQVEVILNALGDAPFYFIPFLLAYTASVKLKCSTPLAMTLAGFLLYPSLIELLGSGEPVRFLGVPVRAATYTSSVIPILLSTILLKFVERLVDLITPEWSKNFLKPLLILIITAPVTLIVLGPLGAIIGDGIAWVLDTIYNFAPWLAMTVFAGLMPFLVMTGMHYAFLPPALSSLSTLGYELMLIPAMLSSNLAQAAASAAVAVKTKDTGLKQVAVPASVSAFFAGVTEPALYGVTLRLKTPLIAACAGGAVGGLWAGLTRVASYGAATPCLTAIIQFIAPDDPRNLINAIVTAGLSIVISFGLTLVLYRNPADETARKPSGSELILSNPVAGHVLPLGSVEDEAFADGVLGQGYAILPNGRMGRIVAPFDGSLDSIADSQHALGLVSDDGIELLIHVGLETVGLGGKHFIPRIREGEHFRRGDVLMEFDLDALRKEGVDTTTPVIITNTGEYRDFAPPEADGTADELRDMIHLVRSADVPH